MKIDSFNKNKPNSYINYEYIIINKTTKQNKVAERNLTKVEFDNFIRLFQEKQPEMWKWYIIELENQKNKEKLNHN